MKKMKQRNLCKRGFAWLLTLAMCLGMLQVTAFAEEGSEGAGESGTPSANSSTVDVTVSVGNDGNVSVDVKDRPEGDKDASEGSEKDYAGSGESESGVKADVNGKVESTPNPDETRTDEQDRVTHEEGTINGSETITIETPEKDIPQETKDPEATDPSGLEQSDEVKIEFDKDGKPVEGSSNTQSNISADLKDLADKLKPTKPADADAEGSGWNESNGVYTKGDEKNGSSWSVEAKEDGWVTKQTDVTTETGILTDTGWTPPEGATQNENGTYTKTETSTTEDGTTITTTTTYNPATGTFEKTTTTVTTETVTFKQDEEGSIVISGISTGVGAGNGEDYIISLAPTDKVLNYAFEDQKGIKYGWYYSNGKKVFGLYGDWFKHHLTTPFEDTHGDMANGELSYTENALRSSLFLTFMSKTLEGYSDDKWGKAEYDRENTYMYQTLKEKGSIRKVTNVKTGEVFFQLDGQTSIRKMTDKDGSTVYVYCAQHEVEDHKGIDYDTVNVGDANYFGITEDEAKHVQYIAEKGYWGTAAGEVGSLDKVKELLTDANVDKEKITDGIALTVTQAAIWYYCNKDKDEMFKKDGDFIDIFTQCYTRVDSKYHTQIGTLDQVEKDAAMALFQALIREGETISDDELKKTTDIISQEDIKGTSIEVTGKADADDAELDRLVKELEAQKDAAEKEEDKTAIQQAIDKYNEKNNYKTNVSLTVAVVKDDANSDNMKVVVYADGVRVGEKLLSDGAYDGNGNTTVTIEGVVLPDGANIRLNLEGTQQLAEGAYLFRSDIDYSKSQTMVGYVKGETSTRKVDLDVNMTFNVTDPEVSKNSEVTVTQTVTEKRDLNWSENWVKDYVYASNPEDPENPENPEEPENPGNPGNPGSSGNTPSTPDVTVPDSPTPLADVPEIEVPEEDVPLADTPEEVEIDDPEVPLGDVPRTGDVPVFPLVVAVLGICGTLFAKLGKDSEETK